MWSNVLNSVFTLSNIFNIFSFQWFFFISVRMFGECISQYFLRECVTATRSRLEEEEEGGSYLPYKGEYWSNSPLPTHFRFYDTICVLEICHFFFFFFLLGKKKRAIHFSLWRIIILQPAQPVRVLHAGSVTLSHGGASSGVTMEV